MMATEKKDDEKREQSEREVKNAYPAGEERPYEKAITDEHRQTLKDAGLL